MKRIVISILISGIIIAAAIRLPGWMIAHEEHQKDKHVLRATPELEHIASALKTPHIRTVDDLYEHADELEFISAPNPQSLLQKMVQHNQTHTDLSQATELRVISYNIALLDAELLGFIDYKQTPFLEERRYTLPSLILSRNDDVIFLQEVWRLEDVKRFEQEASKRGYKAFVSPREVYNDGIMTFVKSSLIDKNKRIGFEAEPYTSQDSLEFFPGPQIMRGFHVVDLSLVKIGRMHLYNTHLIAWPQQWNTRMDEVRQLGLHAAHRNRTQKDIVIVAGDMNCGPYYPKDTWVMPDKSILPNWWKNALAYPLLLFYGNLTDMVVMGGSQNNTVTDENELYRMQYAGTEYPARIDQLLLSDPHHRVYVVKSGLIFTDKLQFGPKLLIEPSDHYGIFVDLRIIPHE